MPIAVFLADDHAIVRDGLRALLEAEQDIRVVGDAANGLDAVRQVRAVGPNVVVMDIAMPEMNGIDAALQILQTCPQTKVIMLSMHSSVEHVFRALQAGARGYLLKDSAGCELVRAVRAVHAGERFLGRKIQSTVIDDYIRANRAVSPLASLSHRERQILQLIAEGKSSAEAATLLFLSPKTVETYRSRLMRKLGVDNYSGLVRFAVANGLTPTI